MKRKRLPWAWFRHGLISIMWSSRLIFRTHRNRHGLVCGSRIKYGVTILPKDIWVHVWLPKWCQGRGYYISIGLWLFSVHRGY